ncbi:unnamed protein product [Lupinus luteus]|uniref:Uncharacterized protein n=1 Tax=Lupinus luteus TaxID=3873 RepID=A0AAV1VQL3_LUPLU
MGEKCGDIWVGDLRWTLYTDDIEITKRSKKERKRTDFKGREKLKKVSCFPIAEQEERKGLKRQIVTKDKETGYKINSRGILATSLTLKSLTSITTTLLAPSQDQASERAGREQQKRRKVTFKSYHNPKIDRNEKP